MPNGDGTGPRWARNNWNCRRGYGAGFRYGRFGFGNRFWNTAFGNGNYNANNISKEDIGELRVHANELKNELHEIMNRISALENKNNKTQIKTVESNRE